MLLLCATSTFVRSVCFHSWYGIDDRSARFCQDLAQASDPADRIVFANDKIPDILFCADRKGWLLSEEESTTARLRQASRDGASVIVTPRDYPDTIALLVSLGTPLIASPDFVAYRLAPRPAR